MTELIKSIRKKLKRASPLIHCITNPISINQCANLILSQGCRPIMAEHPAEVREITAAADALLLNLGNITDVRMKSMMISASAAKEKGIAIVFDAVGVACSSVRRKFANEFFAKYSPNVIKGNYSEIYAIYSDTYKSCGVDADTSLEVSAVAAIAKRLAKKHRCTVLASGKTDIVTDGKTVIYIENGAPQLAKITGSGCMLGALAACYMTAVCDIYSVAAACVVLGICGELSETEQGGGAFLIKLMDALSVISDEEITKFIKAEEEEIEKN